MSRTIRNVKRKDRSIKFDDKRTGYAYEGLYSPEGVKFLKRMEHKHNRRVGKRDATNGSYHAHEA